MGREPVNVPECAILGYVCSSVVTGLCLSWQLPILVSGGLIGATYGTCYSLALWQMATSVRISDGKNFAVDDEKYIDKSFKL